MTPIAAPGALTSEEENLWRSLGRVVQTLPRAMDDAMLRLTGLSMTEYSVLDSLGDAPDLTRRMADLALETGLSASRITRVVGDLCARGLTTRTRHGADRREALAALTDQGARELRRASPRYLELARRRVIDHVPADALGRLGEVLAEIARASSEPIRTEING